ERAERTAMTVRRQCQRARRFEQNAPFEIDGRHAALAEEMHASAIEAEEFMLLEKRLRRRVILMARHDEPMQRFPVALAGGTKFFGENLKQSFLFQRRDGERPFRAVVAEARSLSSRDRKRSDPTG